MKYQINAYKYKNVKKIRVEFEYLLNIKIKSILIV